MILRIAVLPLAGVLFACGGSDVEVTGVGTGDLSTLGLDAAFGPGQERSSDPRVQRLRQALGDGRADLAAGLLEAIRDQDLGVEGLLLQARQSALLGDDVEAARHVEAARAGFPDDPRVYATASEIATAGGRLGLAQQELEDGLQRCGRGPELIRARGVLSISTPGDMGAAKRGLADLEAARQADPELPFLDWPQSEAHRLVGQISRGSDPAGAEEHLRSSLRLDAGNRYAAEALGELLIANNDWEGGLGLLNGLIADGASLHAKVAGFEHAAGMASLLVEDREASAEHMVRARELGMTDLQLGSGLAVLSTATLDALEGGRAALDAGDLEGAEALFGKALHYSPDYEPALQSLGMARSMALVEQAGEHQSKGEHTEATVLLGQAIEQDPQSLEAHVFLGASQYELGQYTRASKSWRWAVDAAQREGMELPEPLHLKLAQALLRAGDSKGARTVLGTYLSAQPEGRWAVHTRDFESKLDAIEGAR